jgi:hypothetical protein
MQRRLTGRLFDQHINQYIITVTSAHTCSNPWNRIAVGTKSSHDDIDVRKLQAAEPHISSPFADILRATNQHDYHHRSVMHVFARSNSSPAGMNL